MVGTLIKIFPCLPHLKLKLIGKVKETVVSMSLAWPSPEWVSEDTLVCWDCFTSLVQEGPCGAEVHGKIVLLCSKENGNFIYYTLNSSQVFCKEVSLFFRGLWWEVIHYRPQLLCGIYSNCLLVMIFPPVSELWASSWGIWCKLSLFSLLVRFWPNKWTMLCSKKESDLSLREHLTQGLEILVLTSLLTGCGTSGISFIPDLSFLMWVCKIRKFEFRLGLGGRGGFRESPKCNT